MVISYRIPLLLFDNRVVYPLSEAQSFNSHLSAGVSVITMVERKISISCPDVGMVVDLFA